jgi:hypothetical protein
MVDLTELRSKVAVFAPAFIAFIYVCVSSERGFRDRVWDALFIGFAMYVGSYLVSISCLALAHRLLRQESNAE